MTAITEWSQIKEASRIAAERRVDAAKRRRRQVEINATPETLRKLQRPVIDRMLEQGRLTDHQHRAAEEIAHVWQAVTACLFARVSDPSRSGYGRAGREEWSPALVAAYTERYAVWRDEAGARLIGHRRTVADLVFAVAVDNYGPRQIANIWGMDQRTVLTLMRESLYRYAELAGWTAQPGMPLTKTVLDVRHVS